MQVSEKQTLPLTDSALVEFARRGDREAFGELIRRHQQKCIDLATFFLRNRGDAEDEAQNAFSINTRATRSSRHGWGGSSPTSASC